MPCYAHGLIGGLAYEDIIGYMGDGTIPMAMKIRQHFASLALAAGEQGGPIRQNQSLGMKLTRVVDEANKTVRKLWNESKEVQWCLDCCAAQPNVSFLHTCYILYLNTP